MRPLQNIGFKTTYLGRYVGTIWLKRHLISSTLNGRPLEEEGWSILMRPPPLYRLKEIFPLVQIGWLSSRPLFSRGSHKPQTTSPSYGAPQTPGLFPLLFARNRPCSSAYGGETSHDGTALSKLHPSSQYEVILRVGELLAGNLNCCSCNLQKMHLGTKIRARRRG